MEIISLAAEKYALKYTSDLDLLLQEVLDYTEANHPQMHMISGKLQGKFLSMLSTLLQPKAILEIGTFTGFSALCLAKGLTEKGILHTIENREDDAAIAKMYFEKSGYKDRIKLHIGNAADVIPLLKESWDIVFIDADKVNYSKYYDLILPYVRKGGIILADNVLFHGQVLETDIRGKNAIAIDAFNKKVSEDANIEHVLLTVRDGLMLIRKK